MAAQTEAVHLWVSDSDGEVHVLCNARSSDTEDISMKWREADGEQKGVICGKGIVCGVDMETNLLCLRIGMAFDSPIGKKWSTSSQEVSKVAVGSKHISVLTKDNRVLTTGIPTSGIVVGDTVVNLVLSEVAAGQLPKNLVHLVMDSNDVLYSVTSMGEVHVCRGISNGTKWEFVSKAPPLARRGGFLSSLFSNKKNLFTSVAAVNDQLFCLRKDPQEIWQLVITEVMFGDKTSYKASWNSFKFGPNPPQISLISANPLSTTTTELFAITEEDSSVICLQLQGKVITVAELPFHGCGDIKITSLSACHLIQELDESPLMASTPKIYPKLPKLDENGDCSFCEAKSVSQSLIDMSDPDWDSKYRVELATSIDRWQRGEEYTLPRLIPQGIESMDVGEEERKQLIGKKRPREEEGEPYWTDPIQETPPPAKRHSRFWKAFPRRHLLEGIDVLIKDEKYHYLPELIDPIPVMSSADIASQLEHSFALEEQVINNLELTLGNVDKHSSPVVETESNSVETESNNVETQSNTVDEPHPPGKLVVCNKSSSPVVETESNSMETQSNTVDEPRPPGELVVGNKSSPNLTRYYTAKSS